MSLTPEHPALPKLRAVLSEMGLHDVPMRYEEEHVGYPGGGYMSRQIVVGAEKYCADLTNNNPYVTALDISSRLPPKTETPQS
jgi:hypothetical protein